MNKRSIIRGGILLGAILLAGFFAFVDPLSLKLNFDDPVAKAEFVMIAVMEVCIWWKRRKSASVPLAKKDYALAIIFGLFMMLGYGLIRRQGFEIFYGSVFTVIFSLAAWVYYACFAIYLLGFLFAVFDEWMEKRCSESSKKHIRPIAFLYAQLDQNRFWLYVAILVLGWLPTFIIHYPGWLMFDARNQIAMYYGIPNHHTDASVLIDPDQLITMHHSVPHTVLLGKLLDLGDFLFGSLDAGIFIYCLIQFVIVALTVAYLFKSVQPYLGAKWTLVFLLIFAWHPFFGIGAILMTKDMYFIVFFILYILKYYELIRDPERLKNKKLFVQFLLITIGLLLFRNNALYTLIIISALLFFFIKPKKQLVLYTALFLVFNILFNNVLMPLCNISPGSVREMLSVPFQQTAYYVNKYEEEVTEEEKAVISQILDYEVILEQYDPELSDAVKDTYNKYATTEELVDYFVVWGKMFLKHPLSYVEAYLHLTYGYFFPSVKDSLAYTCYNDYIVRNKLVQDGIPLKEAEKPGKYKVEFYEQHEQISTSAFTCLITDTGFYIWIWIFGILYILKRFGKDRKQYLLYYLPYFAYLIFILVGPANGTVYFRYMMPFLYTLPLALLPLFEYRNARKHLCPKQKARP